jgi:group I intron endonuclease
VELVTSLEKQRCLLKIMKAKLEDRGKTGIYGIFNMVNNKIYIGRAKNIHRRIKSHITNLNRGNKSQENTHLIGAWKKYGRKNFMYLVLECCGLDVLKQRENYYIQFFGSHDRSYGYNFRIDEEGGMVCSEETRTKMKISRNLRKTRFPNLDEENGKKFSKFWKDNPDVKLDMSRQVSDKVRIYKIAQLDYNTLEIIKIFENRFEIKETNPDYYTQSILGCCQGIKNSYKGFKWCYLNRYTDEKVIKSKHKI